MRSSNLRPWATVVLLLALLLLTGCSTAAKPQIRTMSMTGRLLPGIYPGEKDGWSGVLEVDGRTPWRIYRYTIELPEGTPITTPAGKIVVRGPSDSGLADSVSREATLAVTARGRVVNGDTLLCRKLVVGEPEDSPVVPLCAARRALTGPDGRRFSIDGAVDETLLQRDGQLTLLPVLLTSDVLDEGQDPWGLQLVAMDENTKLEGVHVRRSRAELEKLIGRGWATGPALRLSCVTRGTGVYAERIAVYEDVPSWGN